MGSLQTIATAAPTPPCLHPQERCSPCNLYSQLAIGAYECQPSGPGPGSDHLLPRNRALPVLPPRTHIPSTATAAAQMSYHEAVSTGTFVSMVIVHPPPTAGPVFVSAFCNWINVRDVHLTCHESLWQPLYCLPWEWNPLSGKCCSCRRGFHGEIYDPLTRLMVRSPCRWCPFTLYVGWRVGRDRDVEVSLVPWKNH